MKPWYTYLYNALKSSEIRYAIKHQQTEPKVSNPSCNAAVAGPSVSPAIQELKNLEEQVDDVKVQGN